MQKQATAIDTNIIVALWDKDPTLSLAAQTALETAFNRGGLAVSAPVFADGADRLQRAMLQAPADHILDGVAHLVPGGVERLGGFLPGELPRPAGQKQHIGSGQLVLTIAPGNLLDHHATIPAVDASHAVQQENQKAPQRNELEAPLGKMIVTW